MPSKIPAKRRVRAPPSVRGRFFRGTYIEAGQPFINDVYTPVGTVMAGRVTAWTVPTGV